MVNINEIFEDRGEGLDGDDSGSNEDNADMEEIRNLMGEAGIAEAAITQEDVSGPSNVWNYFKKNDADPLKPICKICEMPSDRSGGSTSNMIRHLKKHGIDPGCKRQRQATPFNMRRNHPPSKRSGGVMSKAEKEKIDRLYSIWISADYQPFNVGNSPYFLMFIEALNPAYQVPSRTRTSERLIPSRAQEIVTRVADEMVDARWISITTDGWTSLSMDNMISVSAHFIKPEDFELKSYCIGIKKLTDHTAAGHAEALNEVFNVYDGFKEKINRLTTDNANVMSSTAGILKVSWFGCFPHTLNLVVKDGLRQPRIASVIDSIRTLQSYFKRSSKGAHKLKEKQEQLGLPKHRIVRDCPTRWSSTYYMLERFLEQSESIAAVCASPGYDAVYPSGLSLSEVRKIRDILRPFQETTKRMSGQKYITSSSVIYFATMLMSRCNLPEPSRSSHPVASEFAKALLDSMIERGFSSYAEDETLLLCLILDPRFKAAFKQTNRITIAAKEKLYAAAALVGPSQVETATSYESTGSILDQLHENIATSRATSRRTVGSRKEVDDYLGEPPIPFYNDPLEWWKRRRAHYPRLIDLVFKYLGMIANSVPCERIFSKMGLIIVNRRNCLSSDKAAMVGMIAGNIDLLAPWRDISDLYEEDDDDYISE